MTFTRRTLLGALIVGTIGGIIPAGGRKYHESVEWDPEFDAWGVYVSDRQGSYVAALVDNRESIPAAFERCYILLEEMNQ